MNNKFRLQLSCIAGIIGPLLFVGIFTVEGWLRSGYNPLSMYISALSLGPRGWIQQVNFMVFGILFLVFAQGVTRKFKNENAPQTGPILLTVIATCILLSGPFVMDPMDTPRSQMSLHGTIHGILGGIVFLLMPVSCFIFFRRFRNTPAWKPFTVWTLVMSIIITIALILFTVATKRPADGNIFYPWFGLLQRAVLIPYMFWLFTFALTFYRRI